MEPQPPRWVGPQPPPVGGATAPGGGGRGRTPTDVTPPPSPTGDYEISVKFNEQHIPDSPFLVPVVAPASDARRLTVTGLQVRHEGTPPQPARPRLQRALGGRLHRRSHSPRWSGGGGKLAC